MMIEYLVPVGSKPIDVKVGVRIPGARVRGLGRGTEVRLDR